MRRTTMALLLLLIGCVPLTIAAEGDTNFTNVVASGDISVGDDLTVTDDVTVSGDLAVTGAETHSGAQTFTADLTVSGNGTDILFNTANQNSIGGATKGAKEIFARALTGETGTALTISAGSGITVSSATTINNALTVTGASTHSGRLTVGTIFGGGGCPDLASAATLAPTESCHYVTGSTGITEITTGNFTDGDRLTLVLGGSINITEGTDLTMAGNLTGGAEDSIEFVYLNSKFVEVGRTDN